MKNQFIKFTLISIAALSTVAFAQSSDPVAAPAPQAAAPAHAPADPQKQLNHLTKKLALTPDQQNQILPILTDRQQQVSGINSDTSLSQKQRHAKLMAVRNDSESRLRNVLTDTQRSAYDQMQQEARDRAKAKRQTGVSN